MSDQLGTISAIIECLNAVLDQFDDALALFDADPSIKLLDALVELVGSVHDHLEDLDALLSVDDDPVGPLDVDLLQ
jgi:ABC-type transporter Mla subunit MlaD